MNEILCKAPFTALSCVRTSSHGTSSASDEHRYPSDFFYDTGVDTFAGKESIKEIKPMSFHPHWQIVTKQAEIEIAGQAAAKNRPPLDTTEERKGFPTVKG